MVEFALFSHSGCSSGIVEFSLALYDKAVITNASREGARAGIVFGDPPLTDGEISGIVGSYCQNRLDHFGTPTQVTTTIVREGSGASGDDLTVQVQYQYQFWLFRDSSLESRWDPISPKQSCEWNNTRKENLMLQSTSPHFKRITNQTGATVILVGLMMVIYIGFAALAVDIGHLYLVRNELQNASDAGALAGARLLYNEDGTEVNEGANATAYDAAVANMSEKTSVDVHWSAGNSGDIERGH
jgi:Flp pilus assembly protein TadG